MPAGEKTKQLWDNQNYKKHMSDIHIGKIPWNKGRKENRKEVLQKQSDAHKGRKLSDETKNRMSLSKKGGNKTSFKKGHIVARGDKHHSWKGGFSPVNKRIRRSSEYINWRISIFLRDNRVCVLCSSKKNIEADHYPIPFSAILNKLIIEQGLENLYEKALKYKFFWVLDNGRTLCRECHIKTETYGGKAINFNKI